MVIGYNNSTRSRGAGQMVRRAGIITSKLAAPSQHASD